MIATTSNTLAAFIFLLKLFLSCLLSFISYAVFYLLCPPDKPRRRRKETGLEAYDSALAFEQEEKSERSENIISERARELEQDGTWDETNERVRALEEEDAGELSAMDVIEEFLAEVEENARVALQNRIAAEAAVAAADEGRRIIEDDEESTYSSPLQCDLLDQIDSMEEEMADLVSELNHSIEEAERAGVDIEVIDSVLAEVEEQIRISCRNSQEADEEAEAANKRRKVHEAIQETQLEGTIAQLEVREWWKTAKFQAIRRNTLERRRANEAIQDGQLDKVVQQLEVGEWWKEAKFEASRQNTLERRRQRECDDRI